MKKNIIEFLRRMLLTGLFALGIVSILASGGSSSDDDDDPAPISSSISGGGVKGPLANAVVTVYGFDASQSGFKGASVATGSTNAAAAITGLSLPFPLTPPCIMEFTSTPGTTTDITTGVFPVISTMRTVITQDLLDKGEQIYATPLTTMAVDIAVENSNPTTTAAEFELALDAAATQVVSTVGFGMSGDVGIFDTPPLVDDTTDSTEEQADVAAYRTAVEALTAVVFQMEQESVAGSVDNVLTELTLDLADGEIDGEVGGSPSTVLPVQRSTCWSRIRLTCPFQTLQPVRQLRMFSLSWLPKLRPRVLLHRPLI